MAEAAHTAARRRATRERAFERSAVLSVYERSAVLSACEGRWAARPCSISTIPSCGLPTCPRGRPAQRPRGRPTCSTAAHARACSTAAPDSPSQPLPTAGAAAASVGRRAAPRMRGSPNTGASSPPVPSTAPLMWGSRNTGASSPPVPSTASAIRLSLRHQDSHDPNGTDVQPPRTGSPRRLFGSAFACNCKPLRRSANY